MCAKAENRREDASKPKKSRRELELAEGSGDAEKRRRGDGQKAR